MRCSDYSEFEGGKPITPFQQMLYHTTLSAPYIPPSYSVLMTDPNSPILKYYPPISSLDLTWTKKEFETIVHIPIILEQDLLDAIASYHCDDSLTEDEKLRNSAEPDYIFSYSQKESSWPTPLDSSFFPAIEKCHCERKAIKCFEDIYENIRRNSAEEVYYPEFSSLYPGCDSIRHTTVAYSRPSARDPTKNEYIVTKNINTIISVPVIDRKFDYLMHAIMQLGLAYQGKYIFMITLETD